MCSTYALGREFDSPHFQLKASEKNNRLPFFAKHKITDTTPSVTKIDNLGRVVYYLTGEVMKKKIFFAIILMMCVAVFADDKPYDVHNFNKLTLYCFKSYASLGNGDLQTAISDVIGEKIILRESEIAELLKAKRQELTKGIPNEIQFLFDEYNLRVVITPHKSRKDLVTVGILDYDWQGVYVSIYNVEVVTEKQAKTQKYDYITIRNGKCGVYNSILNRMIDTDYVTQYHDSYGMKNIFGTSDILFIVVETTMGNCYIPLIDSALDDFRSAIDKYFEWEKIAMQNNVTTNKDISEINIPVVMFYFGNEAHIAKNLNLTVNMRSVSEKEHYMTIITNSPTSTSNQFITFNLDRLFFSKSEAGHLRDSISTDSVNNAKEKLRKKRETDSLFK